MTAKKKSSLGIMYVCQKCKKERETTRSREVYTKNYQGPCGDSFCFASCDMDACRPLSLKICDDCFKKISHPKYVIS